MIVADDPQAARPLQLSAEISHDPNNRGSAEVIGVDQLGTIEWDFAMGEVRVYTAVDKTWRTYRQPPEWQINDMYVDETRHFLNCLEGKENAVCDVAVGAAVLAIAMAAKHLGKREHHRASDD